LFIKTLQFYNYGNLRTIRNIFLLIRPYFYGLRNTKNKSLFLYYVVSINYFVIIPLFQFLCFVSTRFISVNAMFYNGLVFWKLGALAVDGWAVSIYSRCLDHTWWTHGPRRVSIGVASITHSVVATMVQMSLSLSHRVRIQLRAAHARWCHGDFHARRFSSASFVAGVTRYATFTVLDF